MKLTVCAIFVVTFCYKFMLDSMGDPGLYDSELISKEFRCTI